MPFIKLEQLEQKEIVPGYKARFIHSENMTIAHWNIKRDAALPEHSHIHEQLSCVTQGEFELSIEGEKKILNSSQIAVIPANAKHSGRAITDCVIIDIFYPIREDYKNK
jgi:quercetin dioxygenase-like cupin family protein